MHTEVNVCIETRGAVCPHCQSKTCIEKHTVTNTNKGHFVILYCACKHQYALSIADIRDAHNKVSPNDRAPLPTECEIADSPYRIQSAGSYGSGFDFNTNKAYDTFTEAEQAANSQACNKRNIKNGNRFIVYKAVALVGPVPAVVKTETIMLEEL